MVLVRGSIKENLYDRQEQSNRLHSMVEKTPAVTDSCHGEPYGDGGTSCARSVVCDAEAPDIRESYEEQGVYLCQGSLVPRETLGFIY